MTQADPGGTGPTSVRSARVSAVRKLHRTAGRRKAGVFLVEGPQAVRELLAHTNKALEVYATDEGVHRFPELSALAQPQVRIVPADVLDAMAQTDSPQGWVAVAEPVERPWREVIESPVSPDQPRLIAVLVDTQDPGNAGTILRTADAAGADAVLFTGDTSDPYNGKTVRASTGSLFHVPIARAGDPAEVVSALQAGGYTVLATDLTGANSIYDLLPPASHTLAGPVAWLFGNEARGLEPDLAAQATARVLIPMFGRAESLNLATAASLALTVTAAVQRNLLRGTQQ